MKNYTETKQNTQNLKEVISANNEFQKEIEIKKETSKSDEEICNIKKIGLEIGLGLLISSLIGF